MGGVARPGDLGLGTHVAGARGPPRSPCRRSCRPGRRSCPPERRSAARRIWREPATSRSSWRIEGGQVDLVDRLRGELPAGVEHLLDVGVGQVGVLRDQVQHARPAELLEHREGGHVLAQVAIVEADHDRLRRQLAAARTRRPRPGRGSPPRSPARRATASGAEVGLGSTNSCGRSRRRPAAGSRGRRGSAPARDGASSPPDSSGPRPRGRRPARVGCCRGSCSPPSRHPPRPIPHGRNRRHHRDQGPDRQPAPPAAPSRGRRAALHLQLLGKLGQVRRVVAERVGHRGESSEGGMPLRPLATRHFPARAASAARSSSSLPPTSPSSFARSASPAPGRSPGPRDALRDQVAPSISSRTRRHSAT